MCMLSLLTSSCQDKSKLRTLHEAITVWYIASALPGHMHEWESS